MLAFDVTLLLENTETILSSVIALLGVLGIIFMSVGWKRGAKKVKEYASEIEESKKEIIAVTDTLAVVVAGVNKINKAIKGEVSKKKAKEIANILPEHLGVNGVLDIISKYTKGLD